jgi:hypothetical protein
MENGTRIKLKTMYVESTGIIPLISESRSKIPPTCIAGRLLERRSHGI